MQEKETQQQEDGLNDIDRGFQLMFEKLLADDITKTNNIKNDRQK